jgi:hypothetical protein
LPTLSLTLVDTFFCVGASLLAMGVNDNAYFLDKRVGFRFIASKLAPALAQRYFSFEQ